MSFYFNPLDENCSNFGGSLKFGSAIKLTVFTDQADCSLVIENDKSKETAVYAMESVNGGFSVVVKGLKIGLYYYHFISGTQKYIKGEDLTAKLSKDGRVDKFQLTVYDKNYNSPSWLGGGLIYQIFPDRFNKGRIDVDSKKLLRRWGDEPFYKPNSNGKILNNDFFGGNFKGIEEKLNYLKSLGVTAVYLNPISKAFSNHRYDTANYLEIDELLGTEEDLKRLIKLAKKKNIRFIFDGVYNHTGDDSVYFNKYGNYKELGAYQSKNSKYYNWYTFQKHPEKYTSWWGINVLPTINKNSIEFEDYICEKVLPYYFNLGFEGVRLDVVDELPDRFVKRIRNAIKKLNKNAVIIGEVWEDATNKIAYGNRREYFQGFELDSVMNYPLKNAIINFLIKGDSVELKNLLREQLNNYPKSQLNILMNILGTHDTARILTVLSGVPVPNDRELAVLHSLTQQQLNLATERLKLAYSLLFTLYGVPTIYYGDELGMQGAKDPFNRRCLDFEKRDNELVKFVKKLSKIRKENAVFNDGYTKVLETDNGVISYVRGLNGEEITVIVNAKNYAYSVELQNPHKDLISGKISTKFNLQKNSVYILKRR